VGKTSHRDLFVAVASAEYILHDEDILLLVDDVMGADTTVRGSTSAYEIRLVHFTCNVLDLVQGTCSLTGLIVMSASSDWHSMALTMSYFFQQPLILWLCVSEIASIDRDVCTNSSPSR
jgi:hypothetical protein